MLKTEEIIDNSSESQISAGELAETEQRSKSGTGWKTIVFQPVPDSIIYLRYLHQLQIGSASSEYHSCPGYQFLQASDLRQYYRFCQRVWL